MTDPTLTQALSTPCKRCGVMPRHQKWEVYNALICKNKDCQAMTNWGALSGNFAARQWVEMNKEVEDGKA